MADWGLLAGLGEGLSTLGRDLTEREVRKQAEAEREKERQRQAALDALAKSQMDSNEFRQMDALNFRPASNTDILNNLALQRGQTEFKSDMSGRTYLRDKGMSPTDLRQQNEQDKRDAAMRLLQERTAAQAELDRTRGERDLFKFGNVSGNTRAAQEGALQRIIIQNEGANQRDANNPGRDDSLDKRKSAILSNASALMKPSKDEYGAVVPGLPYDEAIRQATAMVDMIDNPQASATQQGGGQQQASAAFPQSPEQALAQRANAAIQAIQSDPNRTPQEKAEDIQAVNAVLTQKIRALRGGQ